MNKPVLIFGSAEMADMAHFYFSNDSHKVVHGFCVDDNYLTNSSLNGLPIIPFSDAVNKFPPSEFDFHVALSYKGLNQLREKKYKQVKSAGYSLISYVSTKSCVWGNIIMGDNCFILENQVIQPNVIIGNNVMVWSGNHIGHGTTLEDHCYLSSGIIISGHCRIGARTFVGVSSSIKDFTKIAEDCFIGMGSVITKDMSAGSVSIAESARILDANDRRAKMIKNRYFSY
ncbi:acetyltransferase [Polynucleobacter sp. es-GGE-1]|uniref:acetyltransferase n=1 Tax=Polynucleobacter sp. es-GGE-1 TaxID=1819724 RepID=UPI001C0B0165|nr:acetyltransferase [Polynucleobacter sp. es-GGE-1]MBU3635533.1 acetyltransferase [Polynucleobacter sp. es-GGE-1]